MIKSEQIIWFISSTLGKNGKWWWWWGGGK